MWWDQGQAQSAVTVIAACASVLACASEPSEPATADEPSAILQPLRARDEVGEPIVATLHTRDSELTITSTAAGVRYSLIDADGQRRPNLTLEELAAYDRNLFEVVKFATANASRGASPTAPTLDARVTPDLPTLSADRHQLPRDVRR